MPGLNIVPSHGWVIAMQDGRRLYLEYTLDSTRRPVEEEVELQTLTAAHLRRLSRKTAGSGTLDYRRALVVPGALRGRSSDGFIPEKRGLHGTGAMIGAQTDITQMLQLKLQGGNFPLIDQDAEAGALRNQRRSSPHQERLSQIVISDMLRAVQVDWIVDSVGCEQMNGSRKADWRIHQSAADQSEAGIACEVAELSRIVDAAHLVHLDDDTFDRPAANQIDDEW
jgi:hypothetical protein